MQKSFFFILLIIMFCLPLEAAAEVAAGEAIFTYAKPKRSNPFFSTGGKKDPVIYKNISLKYLAAEKASEILARIAPEVVSVAGGRGNSLVLKGGKTKLEQVVELIKTIDYPQAQVLIESKVVEVSESGIEELGLSWDTEEGGFRFKIDKDTGQAGITSSLLATVNSLASQGKAKILASPRIAALDGHEAVINIGSRIPYAVPTNSSTGSTQWTIQYIDAGVNLRIASRLGAAGEITVTIRPEVSAITEWKTTAAGQFPIIATRNASTCVRVKDGETIVIGGLINEQERENVTKLPFFGDIPLLGLFFQSKTTEIAKTDIVFLITPHVL